MVTRDQTDDVLVCDVCIAMTTDGIGWKAMLTAGDEDNEELIGVAVWCPACAARDFGEESVATPTDTSRLVP